MTNRRLARYSIIAALYVALSLVLGTFSFGSIQLRISEALIILVMFEKDNIIPITLGCFLTNAIGVAMGMNPITVDIVFGTLATFISCLFVCKMKNKVVLSMLVVTIINSVIIGCELALLSMNTFKINVFIKLFITNCFSVGVGEFISVVIMGSILYNPLKQVYLRLVRV